MSCVAVASELDHSLSDQFLACMNKSDGRVQGREAGPIEVIARLSISSTSSSRGCVDIWARSDQVFCSFMFIAMGVPLCFFFALLIKIC